MIAFLAGLAFGMLLAAAMPAVERMFGWPEDFLLRRFQRRIRRLRRRALRRLL